jgi:hypothetical protein
MKIKELAIISGFIILIFASAAQALEKGDGKLNLFSYQTN